MTQTAERWESWMRGIELETRSASFDRETGYETRVMDFRFPSDPRAFWALLGPQIEPCVYLPSPVMAESFLGFRNELEEADPLTMEVYNVSESHEGLEGVHVGYSFRLRLRYRDRDLQSHTDHREALIDAIGEALGVDTGVISETRMADAMEAARRVLVGRPASF